MYRPKADDFYFNRLEAYQNLRQSPSDFRRLVRYSGARGAGWAYVPTGRRWPGAWAWRVSGYRPCAGVSVWWWVRWCCPRPRSPSLCCTWWWSPCGLHWTATRTAGCSRQTRTRWSRCPCTARRATRRRPTGPRPLPWSPTAGPYERPSPSRPWWRRWLRRLRRRRWPRFRFVPSDRPVGRLITVSGNRGNTATALYGVATPNGQSTPGRQQTTDATAPPVSGLLKRKRKLNVRFESTVSEKSIGINSRKKTPSTKPIGPFQRTVDYRCVQTGLILARPVFNVSYTNYFQLRKIQIWGSPLNLIRFSIFSFWFFRVAVYNTRDQ